MINQEFEMNEVKDTKVLFSDLDELENLFKEENA